MKKFLRFVSVFLVVAMLMVTSSCGKKEDPKTTEAAKETTKVAEESTTKDSEEAMEETTEGVSEEIASVDFEIVLPSIEEQVLYDENGFKITVEKQQLELGMLGDLELDLVVENGTDKDCNVFVQKFAVNGLTADDFRALSMSPVIPAGESENVAVLISSSVFEEFEIEQLADLKTDFWFDFDDDEMEGFTVEDVEIKTSLSGTVDQYVNTDGDVLVDQDGIKLVLREDVVETGFGAALVYYFENESDDVVAVNLLDGYMLNEERVDDYWYIELKPHTKTISYATIYEHYLNDIESLEYQLEINNGFFTDPIMDPISVSFTLE